MNLGNKITENWKEIERIEQQVKDITEDPEAGFNADLFWFGGDSPHLIIACKHRTKKKDGTYSKSYKQVMVTVKFCPFTGKPLYQQLQDEPEKKV